jgi:sarcosine oxidase, subunit delta
MLQITCPWCGVRNEDEFSFAVEGGLKRPQDPATITDEEWADYLFNRNNIKGLHYELWQHRFGCRQWLAVARNTVNHEIFGSWRVHEKSPDISELDAT